MLHSLSVRTLLGIVAVIGLNLLPGSAANAQSHNRAKHRSTKLVAVVTRTSKTSRVTTPDRPLPPAPALDVQSIKSIDQYINYLREVARRSHTDEDEREDERSDKSALETIDRVSRLLVRGLGGNTEHDDDENQPEWARQAQWLAAQKYMLAPRAFPYDRVDWSAYGRAADFRDSMRTSASGAGGGSHSLAQPLAVVPVTPATWTTFGPPGYAGGQVSWRVGGLTYDPNNPNRYYAAGSRGGVWQSDDKGQTWRPLIDSQKLIGASCITVDRRDSNTIFIGTGEYDTGYPGIGLLKGRWDGRQWTFTAKGVAQFGSAPIRRILQHPNIPSKLLAAAGSAGLFMSLDSGETWARVAGGSGSFTNVLSNSIGTILYAAADGPGGGVYRSLDSGFTWATVPGAPSPASRIDIAASPITTRRGANTLYAVLATEKQVWKYTPPGTDGAPPDDDDRGAPVWTQLTNFPPDPAVKHPGVRSIWSQSTYYNISIACGAILGDKVTVIYDNLTPPKIGTATRDVLVVGLLDLHISVDGGFLWRSSPAILDYPFDSFPGFSKEGVKYRVDPHGAQFHTDQHALTVNPNSPAGTVEMLAGSDGGAYRISITPGDEPGGMPGGIHQPIPVPIPNIPAPANPPNAKDVLLYEGPYNIFDWYFTPNFNPMAGPYNPLNPDSKAVHKPILTATVEGLNNLLGIGQFYTTAYHPTDALTAIGGTQDNGTQYSFGSFTGWNNVFGGDGGGVGISQTNPAIQYASNYNPTVIDPLAPPLYAIGRTTTGWLGGSNAINLLLSGDQQPFILTGALSKSVQSIYYLATNYLYQFDENTYPFNPDGYIFQDVPFIPAPAPYSTNWKKFRQLFTQNGIVSAISTSSDPAQPQYLAVGTSDGALWFSTNANLNPDPELVNFTRIDRQGQNGGLPVRAIGGICISPSNPKRVFVALMGTASGHVFRCDDATSATPSWTDISKGLPDISTTCIEVLPRNNDKEIAVGQDIGAFYTSDGGATWNNITVPFGLPNVQVNTMTYQKGTKFLNAGTYGRGIWHIDLTNPLFPVPTDGGGGDNGGGGGGGGNNKPPVVTITPLLQSYVGPKNLKLTIGLYQGGKLVATYPITRTLDANGSTVITLPAKGTYDFLLSVPGFLRRRLKNQVVNADTTLTPQLYNGDVDRDNAVTSIDVRAVRLKLNRPANGDPADVNGDGVIDANDLNIVIANVGRVGDN